MLYSLGGVDMDPPPYTLPYFRMGWGGVYAYLGEVDVGFPYILHVLTLAWGGEYFYYIFIYYVHYICIYIIYLILT